MKSKVALSERKCDSEERDVKAVLCFRGDVACAVNGDIEGALKDDVEEAYYASVAYVCVPTALMLAMCEIEFPAYAQPVHLCASSVCAAYVRVSSVAVELLIIPERFYCPIGQPNLTSSV